ncbi:Uncharacterised protein [uncultured archaeon]|nr:Uncharacterised protein [uncultured archaeon]
MAEEEVKKALELNQLAGMITRLENKNENLEEKVDKLQIYVREILRRLGR